MVLAFYRHGRVVDDTGRVSGCRATEHGPEEGSLTLCRYLILPGLYAKEYELRFDRPVLTVIVVALLTAGYSFTALLCFACRNERFQADGVFMYRPPPTKTQRNANSHIDLPSFPPSSVSSR